MRKAFTIIIVLLAAWNTINTVSIQKLNLDLVKTYITASNQATKQDSIILQSVYRDLSKVLDMNIEQTKMEYEYLRTGK